MFDGEIARCLAHQIASILWTLLRELGMVHVIIHSSVDKHRARRPSRGCHRCKTPTRRIDLHVIVFGIAPMHRLDTFPFFFGFLHSTNCSSFLLSQSCSALCTLATPRRTMRAIALELCVVVTILPLPPSLCPPCLSRRHPQGSLASGLGLGRDRA